MLNIARNKIRLTLVLAGWLCTPLVFAESADRDKPVNLEADKITVDDKNKVHVFEGRVTLTQGSLTIRADKLVVTQDADGFQRGVATAAANGLVRFRQKRDGKDEHVEGEAERIEHDSKGEKTEFFNRAIVKSGSDEVRGQYIRYDGKTENYVVTNGTDGTTGAGNADAGGGRVRAVIQPKAKEGSKTGAYPKAAKEVSPLKTAPDVTPPR